MNTFVKLAASSLVAMSLLTQPVLASSSKAVDAEIQQTIREKLGSEGYEVRKIKMENGQIEVYALKDGVKLELYLDQDMNIVRTKTDD